MHVRSGARGARALAGGAIADARDVSLPDGGEPDAVARRGEPVGVEGHGDRLAHRPGRLGIDPGDRVVDEARHPDLLALRGDPGRVTADADRQVPAGLVVDADDGVSREHEPDGAGAVRAVERAVAEEHAHVDLAGGHVEARDRGVAAVGDPEPWGVETWSEPRR